MPIKTRAAVCLATNEPLTICELDLADPGPGQVMIRFLATGICHGDLHVMDGSLGMEMPMVLGHEGIGEIIALGEGVTDFAVGDDRLDSTVSHRLSLDASNRGFDMMKSGESIRSVVVY